VDIMAVSHLTGTSLVMSVLRCLCFQQVLDRCYHLFPSRISGAGIVEKYSRDTADCGCV
jgi:hypothetical protein